MAKKEGNTSVADVHLENGNIFSPCIVLADDPSNEDNVLIVRLGTAVSVPKSSVSKDEGTPEAEE